MYLDKLLTVSDAQAFTAAAVSENSVDLGASTPARQIGGGEPMGFGVTADVLLSATSATIEVISATDAALTTSVVVHATYSRLAADLPAGGKFFAPLPMGAPTQRYLGVRVTPVGGAATVTLTIWLTPASMFSLSPVNYPKSYAV